MAPSGATGGRQPGSLSEDRAVAAEKRAAARAAAELVQDGMRLGLGTGSTVAHLLPALAERGLSGLRCAATSPATAAAATKAGLLVEDLDALGELDLAIDGADQVDPECRLIKGGGGALTREKIVAAASRRFVVIASAAKAVSALSPPVPLELLAFGLDHTLSRLAPARLRQAPLSPDGGVIADYHGPIGDAEQLASQLSSTPGLVEHGLFPAEMVSLVILAGPGGIERRRGRAPAP